LLDILNAKITRKDAADNTMSGDYLFLKNTGSGDFFVHDGLTDNVTATVNGKPLNTAATTVNDRKAVQDIVIMNDGTVAPGSVGNEVWIKFLPGDYNRTVYFSNADGNGAWDEVAHNWVVPGTAFNQFIDGDAVIFDDAHLVAGAATTQAVNVIAAGVQIGNMTVDASSHDFVFSGGAITGAGSLTKNGTGKLTLSGANTYTGTTIVNVGTLKLGNANALPVTTNLTVASGATIDIGLWRPTVNTLNLNNGSLIGVNVNGLDIGTYDLITANAMTLGSNCIPVYENANPAKLYTLQQSGNTLQLVVTGNDYSIYVTPSDGGVVIASKLSANAGETIMLTIIPEGYNLLSSIIVFYTGSPEQTVTIYGININTRYFIMPDHDVTVTAVFTEMPDPIIQRSITIVPSENGKVVSDKLFSKSYEKVTLTITPDAGFELSTITVYNDYASLVTVPLKGEGDTLTFLMPPYPVTVISTFTATPYSTTDNCIDCHSDRSGRILQAWTLNGMLHVSGLTPGQSWQVYSLTGQLIYTGIATDVTAERPLPARGIYIIKSGEKQLKIEFRY
jgi:autotransporter-associated beta strand protein